VTETEVGVGIVGAGRVGQAIARRLAQRGEPDGLIFSRTASRAEALAAELGWRAVPRAALALTQARLTLLAVPDGALDRLGSELASQVGKGAPLGGRIVAHCAGSRGLQPLLPLQALGVAVGVFHPLAPIPDGDPSSLDQTHISIEADALAGPALLRLAAQLGCRTLLVGELDRSLYHAAAVFAGVLPVLLERISERVGSRAGGGGGLALALRELYAASGRNVLRLGPERALTGPEERQDSATVSAHLASLGRLDPALASLYRSIHEAARQTPADPTGKGEMANG